MADQKISQLTAASTPLAGTEVLPLVQSSTTKKVAVDDLTVKNIRSNSTSGLLQLTGPAAAATRVMTTPDANFSVARTDAAQTFTGAQTFSNAGSANISLFDGSNTSSLQQNSTNLYSNVSNSSASHGTFYWRSSNAFTTVLSLSGATGNLTTNTGNLVIGTAGKGIDFSANPSAPGMTSELLSWYEEGTFDAQITDGTNNATMDAKTCRYTRIGRQVFVHGNISTTSVTGLSGPIYISGLPFAIGGFSAGSIGYASGFNITAGYAVTIGANSGESRCYPQVWDVATGTTQMDTAEWSSDGNIVLSFTYTV